MSSNDPFQARVEASDAAEADRSSPSSPAKKPPQEYGASQDIDAASSATDREHPEGGPVLLKVKHECFGLARGTMSTEDYTAPNSKCIKCSDCGECQTVKCAGFHLSDSPTKFATSIAFMILAVRVIANVLY